MVVRKNGKVRPGEAPRGWKRRPRIENPVKDNRQRERGSYAKASAMKGVTLSGGMRWLDGRLYRSGESPPDLQEAGEDG